MTAIRVCAKLHIRGEGDDLFLVTKTTNNPDRFVGELFSTGRKCTLLVLKNIHGSAHMIRNGSAEHFEHISWLSKDEVSQEIESSRRLLQVDLMRAQARLRYHKSRQARFTKLLKNFE